MKKIGVVGTGVMGIGISQLFAQAGKTVLIKSMRNNAKEALNMINRNLEKLVSKGKITQEELENTLSNISIVSYDEELSNCDLIVEAIEEDIKSKKDLFAYLDMICEEKTIIATNTSSLSITEIGACTNRPRKVIGMHFFNPATIMKLVEIVQGLETDLETVEKVKKLSFELGKEPVEVNEAPGFLVNRMIIPMINEAICILSDGIASKEDIDKSMKLGANHPMGPLELGDLIGLDVCLRIMDILYKETGDCKYRANSLLRKYVRVGWLGRKTGKGFYEY
ncbi:3-hydroxybutyryl-CoA dehydrogenase [Clostridium paraputrificum]|uniref:3-hydroxybutyryl-CoA dehydrogenase n=1 Tax=Clostridium paraputrificum TaxID=29363 RepID=A0A6N3DGZ1_9CLOT